MFRRVSHHAQETGDPTAAPQRPRLALRVGITGARDIPPERIGQVRAQIKDVLTLVHQQMMRLAETNAVRGAYRRQPDGAVGPELQFLSPLAEGADRLAAEAALELGYTLYVPMPFRRAEYVKDFGPRDGGCSAGGPSPSALAFDMLVQRAASVVELDGARDDPAHGRHDEARSYEAVGRLVVRNCDLLIAVWDGQPGKGRGGTADTVRFSANFGPPVWWIRPDTEQPPHWVDDVLDLDRRSAAGEAAEALHQYLAALVAPPTSPAQSGHSVFERIIHRLNPVHASSFEQWLAETKRPSVWYWTAYHRLLKWVTGLDPPWTPPKPPAEPVARHWYEHFRPADDRASECAARYRSVYVLIFLLAAISVTFAAVSAAATHERWMKFAMTAFELVALGLILLLVIANLQRGWHTRWIDYRLLAELCRKQQSLAPLGWSLPVWAVRDLAGREEEQPDDEEEHTAWVAWYFAALLRAAPLPQGVFEPGRTERARAAALDDLVREQLHYHSGRRRQYQEASRRFTNWGEWLFILLLLLIVAKLLILLTPASVEVVVPLGILAIIVPALAAASVGIRAYAELELLAGESRHMGRSMRAAEKSINSLVPERPLASQQLGALVYGVATLMLQDVQGWVRLFRVKNVEAGA
jgi:hypothetical protein